jgi:hypothetical protein
VCGGGPGGNGAPCSDVVCGSITYYFLSYVDNRDSLAIVGYVAAGHVVRGPTEEMGTRYIETVTLNSGNQTATLAGQPGEALGAVTVPWSAFR